MGLKDKEQKFLMIGSFLQICKEIIDLTTMA